MINVYKLLFNCSLILNNSITYNKDIKLIFEKRCAQCHNSNWPNKNWLNYNIAYRHKDIIKFRVENKTMPPGNQTNMTTEERKKVIQWVNTGAKE